jgi:predicted N-acyltransferase
MATLRLHASLDEIPAAAWDALHDGRNPFVSHAFLHGLEQTGCLRPRWGWSPLHAALWDGARLLAAAPAYLKGNSHGEFVFDHAWANAWLRHGLDYYPKWLVAVPYTPVSGPRLLASDADARRRLCRAMAEETRRRGLSSLHVNFLSETEDRDVPADWLARRDVQFHWRNPEHGGAPRWRDFGDFLAALTHKRRKNIRAERAAVTRAGIGFRVVHGGEASEADLAAMHAFYCRTFMHKGNSPALTLDFFRHLARAMPQALVLILAERADRTVAGALCLRGGGTLYGRYWGSDIDLPGLHFETCYYQGIDYCLREGLTVFEPGAQGEHKIARGFLPVPTRSRHYVAHPAFAEALADWCRQERAATQAYLTAAMRHTPYRDDPAHPAAVA